MNDYLIVGDGDVSVIFTIFTVMGSNVSQTRLLQFEPFLANGALVAVKRGVDVFVILKHTISLHVIENWRLEFTFNVCLVLKNLPQMGQLNLLGSAASRWRSS